MRKIFAAVLSAFCLAAGLLAAAPAAQAGPADPPAGYSCGSVPISVTKTDGRIVGKMRLACERPMISLQLSVVITRNGGGDGTWYKTVNCYNTDNCSVTFSAPDVAGSQTYRFVNEPTPAGTFVANSNEGKKDCFSGIYCGKDSGTW